MEDLDRYRRSLDFASTACDAKNKVNAEKNINYALENFKAVEKTFMELTAEQGFLRKLK